jgi:hypothetical protein
VDKTARGRAGATRLGRWRYTTLRRAGFDAELADAVSREGALDLHALIELVERGCPPELAARILAPLDDERHPC